MRCDPPEAPCTSIDDGERPRGALEQAAEGHRVPIAPFARAARKNEGKEQALKQRERG